MSKLRKTGYNLNEAFRDTDANLYRSETAKSLQLWMKMGVPVSGSVPDHSAAPFDLGPYEMKPAYNVGGAVGTAISTKVNVGVEQYQAATLGDADTAGSGDDTLISIDPAGGVRGSVGVFSFGGLPADNPGLGTDRPFTISMWVRIERRGASANAGYSYLVQKEGSGTHEFSYQVKSYKTGYLIFTLYDDDNSDDVYVYTGNDFLFPSGEADTYIDDPVWQHIVVTYDGRGSQFAPAGMKIYKDGELYSPLHPSGVSGYIGMKTSYTGKLYFGSRSFAVNYPLSGQVAECAVWGSELSRYEIKAIYNATRQGARKGMSGYTNNPPRIMLEQEDRIPGAYSDVRRPGAPVAPANLSKLEMVLSPYDDRSTVDFETPFAEAKLVFNDIPFDARTITLTGAYPGGELLTSFQASIDQDLPIKVTAGNEPKKWGPPTGIAQNWIANYDVMAPNDHAIASQIRGADITIPGPLPGYPSILVFNSEAPAGSPPYVGVRFLQTWDWGDQFLGLGFGRVGNVFAGTVNLSLETARGPWQSPNISPVFPHPRIVGETPPLDMEGPDSSDLDFCLLQVTTDLGTTWSTVHALLVGNEDPLVLADISTYPYFDVPNFQGGGTIADSRHHTIIKKGETHGMQHIHLVIRDPHLGLASAGTPYGFRITQVNFLKVHYDNWAFRQIRAYRAASPVKFEFQRGVISEPGSIVVDLTGLDRSEYSRWLAKIKEQKITAASRGDDVLAQLPRAQIKKFVRGMQAASRFAAKVNEYSAVLKIEALVYRNEVTLRQLIPGRAGNTPIEVGGAQFHRVDVPTIFEGGKNHRVVPPTGLPWGSPYLGPIVQQPAGSAAGSHVTGSWAMADRLTNVASPNVLGVSLNVAGVSRKGVADGNPTLDVKWHSHIDDKYIPYDDSLVPLPELEFYEEGTPPELKEGFNSPLKDKAMIVIDLEPKVPTQWGFLEYEKSFNRPTRRSHQGLTQGPQNLMVYFNFDEQKWETQGPGFTTRIYNNTQQPNAVTEFLDTACIGFSRGVELSASGTNSACRPINDFGFPFHPKFHADTGKTLKLSNYIDRPFVLEKYVYEYSGSYSTGLAYDFLANMAFYDGGMPGDAAATTTQNKAQLDNGENRGWNSGRTGLSWDTAKWQPNFVDQCHRAAINSFFILRQTRASREYEYNIDALNVDENGRRGTFTITGSIPRMVQLVSSSGDQPLTYVNTSRELVTYGQWTTYNPAPSGSFNTTGSFSLMVNDISGVLNEGLGREVNTEDSGMYSPWVSGTNASYLSRIPPQAGWGISSKAPTSGMYISPGGVHKSQPAPTGSYIMRGVCKRPLYMSGSFSFHTGHDGNDEYNFRTSWEGGRGGDNTRPADPRALANSVMGSTPIGVAPDLDFTNELNFLRLCNKPRAVNVFQFDDTSPYILRPEDELIFGWQTTLPAKLGRVTDCQPGKVYDENGYNFHGHRGSGPNMQLNPGAGKLILFGSFIKEDKEFPSISQQPTNTNQIHETIGNEPVLDEFDLADTYEFAGSMWEQYVTGTMLSHKSIHNRGKIDATPKMDVDRAVVATVNTTPCPLAEGTPWVNFTRTSGLADSGSLKRVVKHVDEVERYYDTLVGDPALYHVRSNPGLASTLNGGPPNGAKNAIPVTPFGCPDLDFSITFGSTAINARWMAAFPFEGFYAGIDRLSLLNGFDDEIPVLDSSNNTNRVVCSDQHFSCITWSE